MKLYKFKSNENLEHVFDIIENERLYCADWKDLNDPMEGIFLFAAIELSEEEKLEKIRDIQSEKYLRRVCSLSQAGSSVLLWAHYANGFRGVAIEMELSPRPELVKVDYKPRLLPFILDTDFYEEDVAMLILESKMIHWRYERERRIICSDNFYNVTGSVRSVILGHRMPDSEKSLIKDACNQHNVRVFETILTDQGKVQFEALNKRI